MKTKLSMASIAILFAFSQSHAYFNDDRFGIAEQPRMIEPINTYSYYKEGVKDVVSQLKQEISDGDKSDYVSSELSNKFLVLKEIDSNTAIEQVVFFRSIGKKLTDIQPVVLKNIDTGRVYVLFSFFSQEQSAHELNKKLNNFNVGSFILKNKGSKFDVYNYLQEKIKLQTPQQVSNNVVKVVTIEKIRYINKCEAPVIKSGNPNDAFTQKAENKKKVASKPKTQQSSKVASANSKAIQKPKATESKPQPTQTEIDKKCLDSVVKVIKQQALFNLETLQFKYKNQIYSLGDSFAYNKCKFKIAEVWREDFNFFIKFADNSDENLNARIKFPQNDSLTTDNLFFDPEKTDKEKTIVRATANNQTSDTAQKNQKLVVEQEQPIALAGQSVQDRPISSSNTSVANCDFRPLYGIRTQLIKKADGEYKTEPIYNFYKGKILPVDYYEQNGYIVVLNPKSQAMIIKKENFAKSCKL